ncbi:hypothetical protein JCM8547_002457 [Rhodosporidiobolus lusitaniae]
MMAQQPDAAITPPYRSTERIPATISRVTEEDLTGGRADVRIRRAPLEVEPIATRAPFEDRVRRFVHRMRPLIDRPDVLIMKAVAPGSSRVGAVAFWHRPGAAVSNCQKRNVAGMADETDEDREAYEQYDWERWNSILQQYDDVRRRTMGDEPHWYLGPMFTHPDFQGQGLAGQLLQHAINLADAHDPAQPMYLEASPAGMPVYTRYGWVRIEGTPTAMLRRVPPAAKAE